MKEMKCVYGPVPSRRLGISLGVSPIPKKTCNYSCIYCQLGRTDHMTNTPRMFFEPRKIMDEFDEVLRNHVNFDVVTIVGEGEPTLYLGLGELIRGIQEKTDKPVAVITNGALLYDAGVRLELSCADIVLPTLDAYDDNSFRKINRPHGTITFNMVNEGLKAFTLEYQKQIWIEIMLMDNINDDDLSLIKYSETLKKLRYDRLYINTPVRPPAEPWVKAISPERMDRAIELLGGISIDLLHSEGFHSGLKDDFEGVLSIIRRHPMNQFEIEGFLRTRDAKDIDVLLDRLKQAASVAVIHYKGYDTYRMK